MGRGRALRQPELPRRTDTGALNIGNAASRVCCHTLLGPRAPPSLPSLETDPLPDSDGSVAEASSAGPLSRDPIDGGADVWRDTATTPSLDGEACWLPEECSAAAVFAASSTVFSPSAHLYNRQREKERDADSESTMELISFEVSAGLIWSRGVEVFQASGALRTASSWRSCGARPRRYRATRRGASRAPPRPSWETTWRSASPRSRGCFLQRWFIGRAGASRHA